MLQLSSSITVLILIVGLTSSAFLPGYFKKCSLSSPYLNKCLTKNAIQAWPTIVQGDKKVHIQPMDPLYVTYFQGVINNKLFGNITNAILTGLADMKIDEIKLDQNKQIFNLYFLIPRFNILGTYNIHGEIINLEINGEETVNTTFYNVSSHLQIEYELIEKKDEHYIEPMQYFMVYNTTFVNFYIDNVDDSINEILNDNWEIVNAEISETFGNVFGEIFKEIIRHFFKKVSFEQLFSQ